MASTLNLADLKTPDVYIEEVPSFPPSIVGVETAIPVFIGQTEKVELTSGTSLINDPIRITSYNEFQTLFGGPLAQKNMVIHASFDTPKVKVKQDDGNGNEMEVDKEVLKSIIPTKFEIGEVSVDATTNKVNFTNKEGEAITEVKDGEDFVFNDKDGNIVDDKNVKIKVNSLPPSGFRMAHAVQMYFANGGGPCYIVTLGKFDDSKLEPISPSHYDKALVEVSKVDEVTLFVFPDADRLVTKETGDVDGEQLIVNRDSSKYYTLYGKALDQCKKLQDRFTIIDVTSKFDKELALTNTEFLDPIRGNASELRSNLAHDRLDYGAAYYPYLKTNLTYAIEDANVIILNTNHTSRRNEDYSSFNNITIAEIKQNIKAAKEDENPSEDVKKFLQLEEYINKLDSDIKALVNKTPLVLPPSSAIAGIYARTDNARGVWKAPANTAVSYVKGLAEKITFDDQEDLNVHPTGKSINAIRYFRGQGNLVWGARTLDGNSNEWRYLSVRRFFNYAEESIKKGTQPFVFEPNDRNTWSKVQGAIENFLLLQWRAGALAGATPEEAYFVKVGLPETMTALDILEGRMIVEIGMAVVRPAEFIILRFSHKMQES